jgi:hypothetical protein
MAEQDKSESHRRALGLVGARSVELKKGADHGINVRILVRDDLKAAKPEQIIIKVKGGKASADHVRDLRELRGVMKREKAAMGPLITLQPPAEQMEVEAASAGFYEHRMNRQKYPRV